MSKYILLLLTLCQIISCSDKDNTKNITGEIKNNAKIKQRPTNDLVSKEGVLLQLKSKKAILDNLKAQKKLELEVLVKEPNKDKLTLVINEQWPEEVETTFNIWKNSEGKVIVVGEYPFSESGDWDIEYLHYFNKKGKIFSFERNTHFFNSICTEGVAHEAIVEFYDTDLKKIDRKYNLVDEAKKELKKENCVMNYDFAYVVNHNLKNYLKKINYRS